MLKVQLKYYRDEHDARAVNGTLAEHKITVIKTKKKDGGIRLVSTCIFRAIEEVWRVLAELNYICYDEVVVLKMKPIKLKTTNVSKVNEIS